MSCVLDLSGIIKMVAAFGGDFSDIINEEKKILILN